MRHIILTLEEKKNRGRHTLKTELTEMQHCSVVKEKCSDGIPSACNYLLVE